MHARTPYQMALNVFQHAKEDARECMRDGFHTSLVAWMLANCDGSPRSRMADPLDMDFAAGVLPYFDASPVVVYSYDMDCDGPSESWTMMHGTVYWRDAARFEGQETSVMPLSQCPNLKWTDLGYWDAHGCDISYAREFYPAPWVADDTIGIPALDSRNDI